MNNLPINIYNTTSNNRQNYFVCFGNSSSKSKKLLKIFHRNNKKIGLNEK
jgi:hypothetical protein